MNSNKTCAATRLIGASFLMMSVSGCFGSSEAAAPYQAPPLDPRDEAPCADPGLTDEALESLGITRLALAQCRKKHQNVVNQYKRVQTELGRKES